MNYKLNLVRNKLKSGEISKVVDVAQEFGYWHTGQFASDYQRLFGEFPSETLALN